MITKKLQNLFLLSLVNLVFNALEKWCFGLDEAFGNVKMELAHFQGLFGSQDKMLFVLIASFVFLWILSTYLFLLGGKKQMAVVIFFGLVFTGEIHHLFYLLGGKGYYPGMVTGFTFCLLGILILVESVKILRSPNRNKVG